MTPAQFIAKWSQTELSEKQAAQQHFLDLCELVRHPTPAAADPKGEWFCFEKGAEKRDGGDGWADVWKKDFFGWEYKGKRKNLADAYRQLDQYRAALENPPLLVVCDLDRIEVHTNFTNTKPNAFVIPLVQLDTPRHLEILRAVFHEPDRLRPGVPSAAMTEDAAAKLGGLADAMRQRGLEPHRVAHFLIRVVFCLFAEDVGLLPKGVFTQILDKCRRDPTRFQRLLGQLWSAMVAGGDFGADTIRHFNGNLFQNETVPELTVAEIERITAAAALEWNTVDASIFGTLFTRGIDPDLRSQLGAQYTNRVDIETIIEPVVLAPLRREWSEVREKVEELVGRVTSHGGEQIAASGDAAYKKNRAAAETLVTGFLERLRAKRVLDGAGGSGNFLYVTLQKLLDLEKEVNDWLAAHGFTPHFPGVSPRQLYLIEINPYAHSLAQVTVQIGYIQWLQAHGFGFPAEPILLRLDQQFQLADALFTDWPAVEYLVGNPPFLGGKKLRTELGDEYVDKLFAEWRDRVPPEADLCCYWFEKARAQMEAGKLTRAGLLATQGIRGGANRDVLKRLKENGDIFFAESDRDWIQDGANVHVSMIGFDNGAEQQRVLDGQTVPVINANLTATADITEAKPIPANLNLSFMGTTKGGAFDIPEQLALELLAKPNPHGRPNSDVGVPWVNGLDVTRRPRGMWIIDFGVGLSEQEAAKYEVPFEYVREHVKPDRDQNNRESYRRLWWQHVEARPDFRAAVASLPRFLCTCRVSKHRMFVWLAAPSLPDSATFAFARSDDYFFGVLHSRAHEVWALKLGTRLETRPRYTPTTCFETFPFPVPTDAQREAIAVAAQELNALRERWLNPPEWTREEVLEFPASVDGPWARFVVGRDGSPSRLNPNNDAARSASAPYRENGIGLARYPRLVPKDADCAKQLAKRTLTNLYNECPTWLANAHAKLDAAVFASYGWLRSERGEPVELPDDQILERLLRVNLERAGG
jgi:type II restriction/modification system DNA methylase subunit YeeA